MPARINSSWRFDPSTPAWALAGGARSGFRPTGVVKGATGLPVGLHSYPTSSVSNSRSRVMIWEAFATESLGRPVARAGRSQRRGRPVCLPSRTGDHIGSPLQFFCETKPLLVKGMQTTVLMRLRLSASPWTTNTGLRKPGPEPVGSGRSAQYTWPWEITIQRLQACVAPPLKWRDRAECPLHRRLDSSHRSRLQDRDERYTRLRLRYKPGFVTSLVDGITARHHGKSCQEWRSQFS